MNTVSTATSIERTTGGVLERKCGRDCCGAWGRRGAPWPARQDLPDQPGRAAHRAPSAALSPGPRPQGDRM